MPRVSTIQIYDRSKSNVTEAREREVSTAQKAATLKEIVRPSDDPRGWAVAQQIKDEIAVQDTLSRNAELAKQVLGATEQVFEQSSSLVERAYELALGAIYKGSEVQNAALNEITELYESLIHTLNTRYGDRTLLAGFRSNQPAFSSAGEYLGDDGEISIELERGQKIALNFNAKESVLGSGASNTRGHRVNIPAIFRTLIDGLKNGDNDVIGKTFGDFQVAVSQLTGVRTEIGARMNRIERALTSKDAEKIDRLDAVSKIEEADPVEVFTDLARDQTALRASLDTTHKILTEVPPDKLFR